MKRIFSILLTLALAVTQFGLISASAAHEIYYDGAWHTYIGNFFNLKINGEIMNCEVPPIVFNDYSVVPARDVFEKLGAEVLWNAENEAVTVNYQETQILLYINDTTAYRNGRAESMPIAPKIINAKTMIPVRYVSESLGFDVDFDSSTDTISITTSGAGETPPAANTYTSTLESYSCSEADGVFTAVLNMSVENVNYSSFTLAEPDRVVVDIAGAQMSGAISDSTPASALVTKVRFGQHEDSLRVVFDLTGVQKYAVSSGGSSITVTIGDGSGGTATENPPVTPENPEEPEEPEEPEIVIEPSRSITIDPGHGGSDPGACFTDENGTLWRETDINLAVSLKVRDILEANGVRVVMTRTTEEDVVRRSRPELANSEKTALFISIHTNSVDGIETANGIETWGSLETSKPLAGVTDKSFAQNVQDAVISKTGATNRGLKDSVELTVLKYSVMPSILVEVGFITNANERANMFDDAYRNKLAEGIAEGILKTFSDMGV